MATIAEPSSRSRRGARRARPRCGHPGRTSARRARARAGAVASAAATVSRRFSPPDSVYGFARASGASRSRSSSSSTRARGLGLAEPERARADLELLAHGLREQLVLGVLEHRADAGQQLARRPADRAADRHPPASSGAATRVPDAGASSPARVRPSVDLPAPFGPVIASAAPARTETSMPDATGCPATRCTASASADSSVAPGADAGAGGRDGRDAGHPHAARGERRTLAAQHVVGRSVGDDTAVARARSRATRSAATRRRGARRRRGSRGGRRACASTASRTSSDARRVEVRGRLVEQHEPRAHREQPGEREPLLLAARTAPWSGGRAARRGRRRRAPARRAARSRRAGRRGSRSRTRRRRPRARGSPARPDPAARAPRDRAPAPAGAPSIRSDPACSPSSSPPSTPASPCSSVDLPEPEAPSSSTRSPGSMRNEASRTAHAWRDA